MKTTDLSHPLLAHNHGYVNRRYFRQRNRCRANDLRSSRRATSAMTETILVALGGNALVRPDETGTFDQQVSNARDIADCVAEATADGDRVVVTHGNGPQVGNVLLQNDAADSGAQQMPLFACSAESQGLIGAALALAFDSAFRRRSVDSCAVPILTPVIVEEDDLGEATKPVGPFYSESEARQRQRQEDAVFREDAGRGWRRVVPSPDPKAVRCAEQIKRILERGDVPIAAGGGGLPVTRSGDGYQYVDGVVDKDLAAAQLAIELGVDRLIILTDVSHVLLNYGTPDEERLEQVDRETAREYLEAGHFERGSMYEKVEAICQFLESDGGSQGVIASLDQCRDALKGDAGTRFGDTDRPSQSSGER